MTMTQPEATFGGGLVLLERQDGIATVTINRPSQHNALSRDTWAGLGEAVQAADAAPTSVRWAKRCIQAIVRDPTLQSYAAWEVERVSVSASPEFREGVRAFMEQRTPRFDGQ